MNCAPDRPMENDASVEIQKRDFHARLEKPIKARGFSTFPTGPTATTFKKDVLPMSWNMCYPCPPYIHLRRRGAERSEAGWL